MASGGSKIIAGSYLGTGADQDVLKVGFKPKRVTVYRVTTRQDLAEHVEGMADDTALKTAGDTGIRSLLGAEGITLKAAGFAVGTDVAVNALGDTYRYVAEE
jgi:hypothetical protein